MEFSGICVEVVFELWSTSTYCIANWMTIVTKGLPLHSIPPSGQLGGDSKSLSMIESHCSSIKITISHFGSGSMSRNRCKASLEVRLPQMSPSPALLTPLSLPPLYVNLCAGKMCKRLECSATHGANPKSEINYRRQSRAEAGAEAEALVAKKGAVWVGMVNQQTRQLLIVSTKLGELTITWMRCHWIMGYGLKQIK